MKSKLTLYTDGSCIGNPGPGGWAYILLDGACILHQDAGAITHTTNNQMELYACIQSLTHLMAHYPDQACVLHTDSRYVQTGLGYLPRRQAQGWKTSARQPVKNKSLRVELSSLSSQYQIDRQRVKAHHTNKHNNQVDLMARQQAIYAGDHPQQIFLLPSRLESDTISSTMLGLFDL